VEDVDGGVPLGLGLEEPGLGAVGTLGRRVDLGFFKISQTVEAATFQPLVRSSPWILRYSQVSFSRAQRSTRARRASGLAGRPGRRGG
jgi:hypothetical protein